MAQASTEELALAQREAQRTGLDANVILAQWVDENGWNIPNSNNFGNITYYGGTNQVGTFKGSNGQKFATYATPLAGADAYGDLINKSYSNVAKAGGPQQQIAALQASPWDAGHYTGLPSVYNAVTGGGGVGDTAPATGSTGGLLSGLGNINWAHVGINVVGAIVGLIILFALLMRD